MSQTHLTIEERTALAAFSKQAPQFDRLYGSDTITRYKRKRVRDHVLSFLPAHSSILELNSGTGEDAIFFAQQGHTVHATDISPGMMEILTNKVHEAGLNGSISHELSSFTRLENLSHRGPYDLVFSNFAGLNCTADLKLVLHSLTPLVKPGGRITLVLLPKFCLWEFLLLFKGKFKTAFRRFAGKKGAKAHIDGEHFRCWYYNPSYIRKYLKEDFVVESIEGLCTMVPPSYIEHFAEKHPRKYNYLVKKESRFNNSWPWRSIGDYYIITARKKGS